MLITRTAAMTNFENHLRSLIQLAMSDHSFDDIEKSLIYSIGKANKIPEKDIDQMVVENANSKEDAKITFSALSFEEKFEYLYNIIQLMKIDNEVFLSEIKYCERLAESLGFDKKVVKQLSARIYSNPDITANRDALMKAAKKYEK